MEIDQLLNFYGCKAATEVHSVASVLRLNSQQRVIASGLFHLIDLPPDGQCLVHMQAIVELFIASCGNELQKETDELIKSTQNIWDKIEASIDSSSRWKSNKLKKVRRRHPIFTFCFLGSSEASAVAIPVTGIAPGFQVLGPFLLKRLWEIKSGEGTNVYEESVAARKLAVTAVKQNADAQFDFAELDKIRIAKSAKNCVFKGKLFFTSNDMTHVRRFLFGGNKRKQNSQNSKSNADITERELLWLPFEKENSFTSRELLFDDTDEFEPTDGFLPMIDPISGESSVELVSELSTRDKSYRAYGEYDADHKASVLIGFPASWFDPWKAKSGERGKIEAMVFSTSIMPWDKCCLSVYGLRRVCVVFEQSRQPFYGIIALSLWMGMATSEIKKLRWLEEDKIHDFSANNSKKLIDGNCFIDNLTGRIWAVSESAEERPGYYKTEGIISLKLPSILRNQLPRNGESGALVYSDEDFQMANRFLATLGKDGVSSVSLARLRKTFQAYFVCGAGFPELWADILAFQPRFHLNSQRYYVTSSLDGLENEWHRMLHSFVRAVIDNLPVKKALEKMSFEKSELSISSGRYLGASSTPEREAVISHFDELWQYFPHTKSELMVASDSEWNAYIGYLYGCLELGTGKRPQRDSQVYLNALQFNLGGIFISDKNNKKYSEARFLPLSPPLKKMLSFHAEIQREREIRKICQGYSWEGKRCVFFLTDTDTKYLVPFSQNKLDMFLENIAGDGYMKGIRNAFRHYLLTHLHSAGVEQFHIDFLAGHRHFGMEPEFLSSPIRWEAASKELSTDIESTFQDLGLRVPIDG